MSGWRTIRQRRSRARRGQVAAIATLFGLLLIVSMIGNFIAVDLPAQMSRNEVQHVIQVENSLAMLQSTILAQSAHPGVPLTMSTPVTLGSQPDPPFGPAAMGSIVQSNAAPSQASYTIAQLVPIPISWTPSWPGCNNCKAVYYNISTNNTNGQTISARGAAGNAVILNLLGENNSNVNVDVRGIADTVFVVVGGSNNSLVFTNSGKAGTVNASFFFFGQYDSLDMSSLTKIGNVNVTFVGEKNKVCAFGNLSATDSIMLPSSSVTLLNVTVTYWDFSGYTTPLQKVTDPTTGFQYWRQWKDGFTACGFYQAFATSYVTTSSSALIVHMTNRYAPAADVAFEEGAVIEQSNGGLPTMISPPPLSVSLTAAGPVASMTVLNFVGAPSSEAGVGTAAVTTHLLSVSHGASTPARVGSFVLAGVSFTIDTAYPGAWASYFQSIPVAFPLGSSCTTLGPSPKVVSCFAVPPSGTLVALKAVLVVQQISFTVVTVQVAIV